MDEYFKEDALHFFLFGDLPLLETPSRRSVCWKPPPAAAAAAAGVDDFAPQIKEAVLRLMYLMPG